MQFAGAAKIRKFEVIPSWLWPRRPRNAEAAIVPTDLLLSLVKALQ